MSCPVAPLPAGLFPDACEVFWIIRRRRLAPASGLLFTDAPTAWEFSLQVTPVARLPADFSQMPRPVGCTGIRCGTLSWLDAGWQTRVLPYAYEIRVWIITRTGGCILAIIKDPKRTNGTLVSLELRSTAGGGRQNEKRTFCAVVFAQSLIVHWRVLHLPLVARGGRPILNGVAGVFIPTP